MKARWRIGLLSIALGLFGVSARALAATSQDATITVTPAPNVSLTLNTSYYDFGLIDVNTSTNSATAVRMNNAGEVDVKVTKQIAVESIPGGWTASTSSGTDTYVLYCATSTARLNLADFTIATRFGAQANDTSLTGPLGTQPIMPVTGPGSSVDLWFRLDMPTKLSSGVSRAITLRFTATAQ